VLESLGGREEVSVGQSVQFVRQALGGEGHCHEFSLMIYEVGDGGRFMFKRADRDRCGANWGLVAMLSRQVNLNHHEHCT